MKYCSVFLLLVVMGLTEGCATYPIIRPADLQMIASSELSFLRAGETTREEVLLKMGNPAARFESDRILIYQVLPEKDGEFRTLAPQIDRSSGLRAWQRGTYSLVLVFSHDGSLTKMGLVGSE